MPRLPIAPILAALALFLASGIAHAHRMKIFASVEADTIVGEIYFTTGGNPSNMNVIIQAPGDGHEVARAAVDPKGNFRVRVTHRAAYTVKADAGMGHVATTTVPEAEFDPKLPPLPGTDAPAPAATPQAPAIPAPPNAAPPIPPQAVEQAVTRAVAPLQTQIEALRKQIDHAEARVRLQDAIAGIGYILGIAGVAFFFLGARRRNRSGGCGG